MNVTNQLVRAKKINECIWQGVGVPKGDELLALLKKRKLSLHGHSGSLDSRGRGGTENYDKKNRMS